MCQACVRLGMCVAPWTEDVQPRALGTRSSTGQLGVGAHVHSPGMREARSSRPQESPNQNKHLEARAPCSPPPHPYHPMVQMKDRKQEMACRGQGWVDRVSAACEPRAARGGEAGGASR